MKKKKNPFPVPVRKLTAFVVGEEICDLGLSHRTVDCHYEVLDPLEGAVRSLMTGEDRVIQHGYFVILSDVALLPQTWDLTLAKKGDNYNNLLDGESYQAIAEEDHTIKLTNLKTGQQSLHARTANCYFYKIDGGPTSPPIDKNGQYLLFDI